MYYQTSGNNKQTHLFFDLYIIFTAILISAQGWPKQKKLKIT